MQTDTRTQTPLKISASSIAGTQVQITLLNLLQSPEVYHIWPGHEVGLL